MLSCEHATDHIPSELARDLVIDQERARSHFGWDPGALDVARMLARLTGAPLVAGGVNRLVVDLNRTRGLARFSSESRRLPVALRQQLIARYWEPHCERLASLIRERVAPAPVGSAFAEISTTSSAGPWAPRRQTEAAHAEVFRYEARPIANTGRREGDMPVLHLAIHSFTPHLNRQERRADIALLYDPRRKPEAGLCRRWARALARSTTLRIRRNYPYRGTSDGLTTYFRRHFSATEYLGIEVEINQALFPSSAGTAANSEALATFLLACLVG